MMEPMEPQDKKKKGAQRAVALALVAAAVLQMISVAFVKPDRK